MINASSKELEINLKIIQCICTHLFTCSTLFTCSYIMQAKIEDPGQPAHLRRLIWAFDFGRTPFCFPSGACFYFAQILLLKWP